MGPRYAPFDGGADVYAGPVVEALVRRVEAGDAVGRSQLIEVFTRSDAERNQVLNVLAASAAAGSGASLEVLLSLIDAHHLDRAAIRRVLINNADVDDAHQDVLITVARKIGNFRSESAFTTWLHTVARNTAIDQLRRAKDNQRLGSELEVETYARRLSSLVAQRSDLSAAVGQLPDHYREMIVLRDVEQRSYSDIAAVLGIEMNTVKSRISRARALLSKLVDVGDLDPPANPIDAHG